MEEENTLKEISQVLEKHVDDKVSKEKLLEVLCMRKGEDWLKKECEVCGKDLLVLKQLEGFCERDVELKVLIYRKFLRVRWNSAIASWRTSGFNNGMEGIGGCQMSPIFHKPINYY